MLYYLYNFETEDLVSFEEIELKESFKSLGYEEIDNTFVENLLNKENAKRRIEEIKILLKETDGMIVVNSELTQQGLEIKYPEIYIERQALRDEINSLEAIINK